MSKWPDEVPVLEGKDFCRKAYGNGRGKHCVFGWADAVGIPLNSRYGLTPLAQSAFDKTLDELGGTVGDIVGFNDDTERPLSLVARMWNRAMARLDYVVGNPECDRHGNLKPVKK